MSVNNGLKNNIIWVAIAIILTLGLVVSSLVIGKTALRVGGTRSIVTVTGSAKQKIKSDYVIWRCSFSAQMPLLADAYNKLTADTIKVKKYLAEKNIDEKAINLNTMNTIQNYAYNSYGQITSDVASYKLTQIIEIRSNDIEGITKISRDSQELVKEGIDFQSSPPEYYYTKLADLKIDMLGLATSDSKARAQKIAESTGSKIGKLRTSKMGVFQITPPNSMDVSDYGIYDTSTIDKEITAVVTCGFEIID